MRLWGQDQELDLRGQGWGFRNVFSRPRTPPQLAMLLGVPSIQQRWSPRGHILKSLALASKVKSLALASRPQVLENWPVLGSRTALFFELLKFCGALEKFFGKHFFMKIAWKIFLKTFFFFFFGEHLRLCPWSLALASSIPVLGLESVCPRKGCPWPWPWPRIFLCPWPWPQALCPRLHLWYSILRYCKKTFQLMHCTLRHWAANQSAGRQNRASALRKCMQKHL